MTFLTLLMTFLTRSNAPPRVSPIVEAIDLMADPIDEILPVKELNIPRTLLTDVSTFLAAPSNMPNCLIELSSPTSQSPNPAAISSRLLSKLPMLSDPNAVKMASPTALTACTPISKTEKTPSATRPILFSVDSERTRLSVNEANALVISISCWDVVGGNTFRNALPTVDNTLPRDSKTEKTPSATRPILFSVDSERTRLSVNEANALVISISCWDVVGGNTFRNALPTVDNTLPRDSKTLDRPLISSALPPRSFHP